MGTENRGLAHSEARSLIRTHTQLLHQWAQAAESNDITPELHEALLAVATRIFEVIEGYPIAKAPKKTNGNGKHD